MMEAAEILGTVVFAVSGVFAVAGRPLDWFGAIVVGMVTAIGGGSLRDLILGNTPVFWIDNQGYLLAALLGSIAAIALVQMLGDQPVMFENRLELADAGGLALFAVVGANVTLDLGFGAVTALLCGLLTGVGGGVIRDLLAGQTPLIMRGDIYATAAVAGLILFVGLDDWIGTSTVAAAVPATLVILGLRLAGIRHSWNLPNLAP